MSLRLRLNLILTFVLSATIVVGMTYLLFDVRRAISEELHSSVDLSSKLIALALQRIPLHDRGRVADEIGTQLARVGNTRHLRIFVATSAASASAQALLRTPAGVPAWFVRLVHPEPLQLVRELNLGEGPDRIVVLADPADEIAESWREIKPVILMLIAFGVCTNVLVYFVLGRSLASLGRIANALRAIEQGAYDVRVAPVGVPDIDVIGERFNHMSSVLQRSNQETQAIAQRSLVIQEDERRRLAQELHDELGQSISAIKALAVAVRDRAGADSVQAASANTIVAVSTDIYAQVRRMMAHLRPVVLDELGLVSALQSMVDDWNARHEDTFCSFAVTGTLPGLSDQIAINCYRIAQEALTNIAKHAGAETASVTIENRRDASGADRELVMRIEDDGVGFETASTMRGLGLVGIGERVAAMRGTIDLTAKPGCGTRYRITVPYTTKDDPEYDGDT